MTDKTYSPCERHEINLKIIQFIIHTTSYLLYLQTSEKIIIIALRITNKKIIGCLYAITMDPLLHGLRK